MKNMYFLEKGDFIDSLFYAHSVHIHKSKKSSILEDITENLLAEDTYATLEDGAYNILNSQGVIINDLIGIKVSFDPAKLENLILKSYKVPAILFREISKFYNLGFVLMSYSEQKMKVLMSSVYDGKACILVMIRGTERMYVFTTGAKHMFTTVELDRITDKLSKETIVIEEHQRHVPSKH